MMRSVDGHVIDDEAERLRALRRPLAGLVRAAGVTSVPDAVDHSALSEQVLNQELSEACVTHALGMALYLRGRFELAAGIGPGIPMPSPMYSWVIGQWKLQERQGVASTRRIAANVGTSLSAVLEAAHQFGIVAEHAWPLDSRLLYPDVGTSNPTFDVPIDLDVTASIAKVTGDYGASGADYPLVARAALALGQFPIQAFDVCEDFFQLRPGNDEYTGTGTRRVIGRHMMVADGYRPGWIRYRGSYGPQWGDGGWIWVRDDYTASAQARDGAAFTATPLLRS